MMRWAIALLLLLAGCDRQPSASPPSPVVVAPIVSPATPPPAMASAPTASPAIAPPPAAVRAPSQSRDPAAVLALWARAVEAREWPLVRLYWGEHGTRSGRTCAAFARTWDRLRAPRVTIGAGDQEGAAGSLYYTAPVTISDGARRISGEIVIRRVNDVDGASPEQLRWHIESLSIAP